MVDFRRETVTVDYDRCALLNYLDRKLANAKRLLAENKITKAEAFRCEVDRTLLADTGPIKLKDGSSDKEIV